MGWKNTMILARLLLFTGCAAATEAEVPFHVMLVNDDGIDSPGLAAVAAVLTADPGYRVTVVGPAEQQSGVGHAIVIRREIAIRSYGEIGGAPAWSVDATPASVTAVGLTVVLEDDPPDLVISGINKGENIGRAAWYSGTLGAAREAVLRGVPAIALSLELDWSDPKPDWTDGGRTDQAPGGHHATEPAARRYPAQRQLPPRHPGRPRLPARQHGTRAGRGEPLRGGSRGRRRPFCHQPLGAARGRRPPAPTSPPWPPDSSRSPRWVSTRPPTPSSPNSSKSASV